MDKTYRKFVVALGSLVYTLVDRVLAYLAGSTPALTGWYAVGALTAILGLYGGANVIEKIMRTAPVSVPTPPDVQG